MFRLRRDDNANEVGEGMSRRLVFKIADFGVGTPTISKVCAEIAQQVYDDWLKEQKVVYTGNPEIEVNCWYNKNMGTTTHQAYLVDVHPIKKCEHSGTPEHVYDTSNADDYYQCSNCNVKVQPTGWTEVE